MKEMEPMSSPTAEQAGEWCRLVAERPLQPAEARAFEAWLDAGAERRAAFERASFIWRALDGGVASPELVALRMDALSALTEQDPDVDLAWWKRPLYRRGGIGALAASLVAAFTFAFLQPAPSRATEYATALGERRVVMLGDGSRLSMDAASEVSVSYSNGRRELVLKSGRARFDVARDPLKPFSVAAGDRLIVATGTSFSVEVLNGEVSVVLLEGRVAVLDRATKRPSVMVARVGAEAADALLKPGQELSLPTRGTARLEDIDPARATSWEAGLLSFADEPLAQAVERMNRYSRTRFIIGDADAAKVEISGVFNADNVDGFVSGVTDVFPVKTTRRGDEVIFTIRK